MQAGFKLTWPDTCNLQVFSQLQFNLFLATIHLGDMEINIDRWLLIAALKKCRKPNKYLVLYSYLTQV